MQNENDLFLTHLPVSVAERKESDLFLVPGLDSRIAQVTVQFFDRDPDSLG